MTDRSVNEIEQTISSITTSLLARANTNDKEAWDRLVELYGPLVYQWCRQKQLSEEDARDTSQEVFRAVARSLANFRREQPEDTFLGWLRTITKNKIRDLWRSKQAEPQAVGGSDVQATMARVPFDLHSEPPDIETQLLLRRVLDFVKEVVSEQHWEVFYRVVVEGADADDVAAEFTMERHNVYTIKSRVLRKIRDKFDLEA